MTLKWIVTVFSILSLLTTPVFADSAEQAVAADEQAPSGLMAPKEEMSSMKRFTLKVNPFPTIVGFSALSSPWLSLGADYTVSKQWTAGMMFRYANISLSDVLENSGVESPLTNPFEISHFGLGLQAQYYVRSVNSSSVFFQPEVQWNAYTPESVDIPDSVAFNRYVVGASLGYKFYFQSGFNVQFSAGVGYSSLIVSSDSGNYDLSDLEDDVDLDSEAADLISALTGFTPMLDFTLGYSF